MTLGEAVKQVRKRLGKNQLEFARMLGCQRNTISRYELGTFSPGPLTLMNLLQFAESAGLKAAPEVEVISRELREQYDKGLMGGAGTLEETVALMRPHLGIMRSADEILSILPEFKRMDFGFRQFVPAVAQVIHECATVDQSVTDILMMWKAHCSNEAAPQFFRDALGFLRARLWGNSPSIVSQQATSSVKPGDK
jgi:transcriptional regulator with XRE-family HTH domain